MNVTSIDMREATPHLHADIWRVVPISRDGPRENSKREVLRVYWESNIVDTRGFWVYHDDDTNWVGVEKDENFKVKQGASRSLHARKRGDGLDLLVFDFAEVVVLILPPGIGVSETSPPARATMKKKRLMLFILTGDSGPFRATIRLACNIDASAIPEMAANLNQAYYDDKVAQSEALTSSFQPHEKTLQPGPDRAIQVALWSTLVACVGVIMAAAALAQGWVKTFGIAFGSLAVVLSLAWLIGIQVQSRHARVDSTRQRRMLGTLPSGEEATGKIARSKEAPSQ